MEGYFSTGQSPQRAVVLMGGRGGGGGGGGGGGEEEEEEEEGEGEEEEGEEEGGEGEGEGEEEEVILYKIVQKITVTSAPPDFWGNFDLLPFVTLFSLTFKLQVCVCARAHTSVYPIQ
jgi:hypothetical protein